MSTEVNLPRSHVAVYPDRCVVCGKERPDSFARFVSSAIGWWLILLWWWWGWLKPFKTRVPACSKCAWKLQARRFGSIFIIMTIAVVVMVYWGPSIREMAPQFGAKYLAIGLIILCVLPLIFIGVFFPPAFDITVYSSSVDYEFANVDYALNFAEVNSGAEWVKLDGEPFERKSD